MVRTARRPAGGDEVALADQVLDLEAEVGEGPAETAYELLCARRAVKRISKTAGLPDEVRHEQIARELEPSPAPHLVEQPSRKLLVLAKRHAASLPRPPYF
jgi:hypothetical protein